MKTFREWFAAEEEISLETAERIISNIGKADNHIGDCTKQPISCNLCHLENLLKEYYEYRFPEKIRLIPNVPSEDRTNLKDNI